MSNSANTNIPTSTTLRMITVNKISAYVSIIICLLGIAGGAIWFLYLTISPRNDPNLASRYFGLYALIAGSALLIYMSRFTFRVEIGDEQLVTYSVFHRRKQAVQLAAIETVNTLTMNNSRFGGTVDYVLVLADTHGSEVKIDLNLFSKASRKQAYPNLYDAISRVTFKVDKQFLDAWESWFYFIDGRNDQFARKLQLSTSSEDL